MNYPQIKPTLNLDFSNTKTLDPRINFRRGTPGAYYDGKTYAKAEENLISYSEDFSQWSKGDGSLAPQLINDVNNTSPSGGDMYKLAAGTTLNTQHWYSSQNTTNNATFSVYAKAAGYNYIWIGLYDANYTSIVVDLRNGEFVSGGQDLSGVITDKNIVDVGDGWYRINYSILSASIFTALGGLSDPSTDIHSVNFPLFTGDGTSGIYVWGAQLEQRDSLTAYTPTNGTPITKYQPKLMFASPDQPRFDHDPLTGESKGLLIEESRTNLIRWSEDFAIEPEMNYYYCTIDDNRIVAPDGNLSADAIIFDDGTNGGLSAGHREVVSSGEKYTASIYAKAGNLSKVWFYFNVRETNESVNVGNSGIKYNLLTNTVDEIVDTNDQFSTEYNIFDVGNGWYRLVISATMSSNAGFLGWGLYNYEDNVSSGKNTAYIWGAQLEKGSFATSYIKTSGASATRSADNASITGENFSSWYRQDEGSLYIDSDKGNLGTSFAGYVSFHTEDFSNSEYYWLLHNSSNQFQFLVAPGVASLVDGIDTSLGSQKACVSWADDDFSMSVNGNTIQSDTDGPAKKNLAGLRIGFSPYSDSHYLNSHIKKISYYPKRLTNEQLQQLTK